VDINRVSRRNATQMNTITTTEVTAADVGPSEQPARGPAVDAVIHLLMGAIADHQTALRIVQGLARAFDAPEVATGKPKPPPATPRRRRGYVGQAVLQVLAAQHGPMTVGELHAEVSKTGPLPRSSVARAITWLLRNETIQRAGANAHGPLYTVCGNTNAVRP
jgi:hypothetical protein